MTIEKTFEWLFKRLQMPNIKPCAFDLECVKFLAEWVNREKKNDLDQNALFAKLYCHVFIQEINFYKDFEFSQKSMNDILKRPLDEHYDIFTQRLNDFELNRLFLRNGIDPEKRQYDENGIMDNSQDTESLLNISKDEFLQFANGKWTKEKTYQALNNQISESINRFRYPIQGDD